MAIPTLASVDSHVMLIILYILWITEVPRRICASSQSKYGGVVDAKWIQFNIEIQGGKQKNSMSAI